jgi:hypothetical protein
VDVALEFHHFGHVDDQPPQTFAVGRGDADEPLAFLGVVADRVIAQKLQDPVDRGQRRAQFMADGGQEFRFRLLQLLALGNVAQDADEMQVAVDLGLGDGQFQRKAAAVAAS